MNNIAYPHLKFINFSDLFLWDFKRYASNNISSTKYKVVKLSDYIQEENLKIKPFENPEEEYEILGVNNKTGLFDAYIEKGSKINQPYKVVKDGFLAYNPYRVNVGSIGLKTEQQKYKYISPAYVVFSCKKGLLPEFLYILFRTNKFNELIRENTTGSVRQTLLFTSMGNIKIPLPSIDIQKDFVKRYNEKIKLAEEQEQKAQALEKNIEKYIFEMLGLKINKNTECAKLQFVAFMNIKLWGADKIAGNNAFISNKYKLLSLSDTSNLYINAFRGKSPKYEDNTEAIILNQKCNRWNRIDLKFAKTVSREWLKSIDGSFKTKENDVLVNSTGEGTIGRATCIDKEHTDLLYDSHILLLRLNTELVNPLYYTYLLNSNFGQEQINYIKSAQSTKQTELGIDNLKLIKFPYPELEVQNKMVEHIKELNENIINLRKQAEKNRLVAQEEFEKELFE